MVSKIKTIGDCRGKYGFYFYIKTGISDGCMHYLKYLIYCMEHYRLRFFHISKKMMVEFLEQYKDLILPLKYREILTIVIDDYKTYVNNEDDILGAYTYYDIEDDVDNIKQKFFRFMLEKGCKLKIKWNIKK